MEYWNLDYWAFGLRPSSSIFKHNVSETGSGRWTSPKTQ